MGLWDCSEWYCLPRSNGHDVQERNAQLCTEVGVYCVIGTAQYNFMVFSALQLFGFTFRFVDGGQGFCFVGFMATPCWEGNVGFVEIWRDHPALAECLTATVKKIADPDPAIDRAMISFPRPCVEMLWGRRFLALESGHTRTGSVLRNVLLFIMYFTHLQTPCNAQAPS
jgi:hypothetical protein